MLTSLKEKRASKSFFEYISKFTTSKFLRINDLQKSPNVRIKCRTFVCPSEVFRGLSNIKTK